MDLGRLGVGLMQVRMCYESYGIVYLVVFALLNLEQALDEVCFAFPLCSVSRLGIGVWCLVFGVWGLEFGVWGLGLRVWRSGFRV